MEYRLSEGQCLFLIIILVADGLKSAILVAILMILYNNNL